MALVQNWFGVCEPLLYRSATMGLLFGSSPLRDEICYQVNGRFRAFSESSVHYPNYAGFIHVFAGSSEQTTAAGGKKKSRQVESRLQRGRFASAIRGAAKIASRHSGIAYVREAKKSRANQVSPILIRLRPYIDSQIPKFQSQWTTVAAAVLPTTRSTCPSLAS
jgi:hypothetical protein